MKKTCKIIIFVIIISLNLGSFNFHGYALDETVQIENDIIKYNGTVDELPKYIFESYKFNDKAESLDVYDENL